MDAKKTKARIEGRKQAESAYRLLQWDDHTGADFADAFLRKLKSLLPRRYNEPEPPKPKPIAQLGATTMNYGAFVGKGYDEVPLERLDWYLKVQEEAALSLRSYLTHPECEMWRRKRGAD